MAMYITYSGKVVRDNNTSDVTSEDSIEFSGSYSDRESNNGEHSNSTEDCVEQYEPPLKKIRLDSSSDDNDVSTRMISRSHSGRGGKNGERGDKNGERGDKNGGRDDKNGQSKNTDSSTTSNCGRGRGSNLDHSGVA